MRKLLLVGLVLAVAACGGSGGGTMLGLTSRTTAPANTLRGTFTLYDSASAENLTGDSCAGTGGYADIDATAQVTVTDQTGSIIGVGMLGEGASDPAAGTCTFSFAVPLTKTASFYSVEVSHRGEVTYSAAQLKQDGGDVAMTLGENQ